MLSILVLLRLITISLLFFYFSRLYLRVAFNLKVALYQAKITQNNKITCHLIILSVYMNRICECYKLGFDAVFNGIIQQFC